MAKKALTKDEYSKMKQLIEGLEADPRAVGFLEPVDFVTFGLIDYPQIIKQPMDLGTVKVKYLKVEKSQEWEILQLRRGLRAYKSNMEELQGLQRRGV